MINSSDLYHVILIDEIAAEEMQYQASNNKIRKRSNCARVSLLQRAEQKHKFDIPLMTYYPFELLLIIWVRLDPQARRQHKLSHRGRKPS